MKNDITSRQFANACTTFFLTELANAVTCIIDGIVTARALGSQALAAVGLAGIYFSLCAIISFTLAASAQSMCTFHLGKGDADNANRVYSSIFITGMVLSGLLTVLGMVFAGPLAKLLGARGENAVLFEDTKNYFLGIFPGTIANIMFAVLNPLLTLDGQSKRANMASLVVFAVDVAFDLLNAWVLHWGTFGMGLATSLSYLGAFIVVLSGLMKKDSLFCFSLKDFKLSLGVEAIKKGFSRGVGMIARALGPTILNLYVLHLAASAGMTALATQGSVKFVCIAPAWGISSAVLLMVGCFFGESDQAGIAKVMRLSIRYILLFLLPLGLLLFALAPQVASCYVDSGDTAFAMTVRLLRIYFLSLPLVGLNFVFSSQLQAVGKTIGAYLFNAANEFAGQVLCAVVMGQIWGIDGVWWSFLVWQALLLCIYVVAALLRRTKLQKTSTKLLFLEDSFCSRNAHIYEATVTSIEESAQESSKIIDFCLQNGIDSAKSMKLALCMEELCDNVVQHGFKPGKRNTLEVRVAVDGDTVTMHLRDDCPEFNFKDYVSHYRFDPAHPEQHIGIRLVIKAATEISYTNTINVNNLIVKV